ncbi:MAG: GNAT family N-acetyltransferase [Clostridium sp.]|nr:GNAT family N-acetyltransferase [Clostridium sp.]
MAEVNLRAVEPGDVDALYGLEMVDDVRRVSWGECPLSRQLIWEYVRSYTADICRDRQLRLIVEAGGEFAGAVDITDYDPANAHAMLGIGILPEHRGRGVAKAAILQALELCRRLSMRQAAAMVAADNEPSMRLFAACGFERVGLLRNWLGASDAAIWQKELV